MARHLPCQPDLGESDGNRIAFVCDHRYPYTVGGAQRYYGTLTQALASERAVTYLTRRFWPGERVRVEDGVEVIGLTVARAESGHRRRLLGPKLLFALAVFWHLLLHGGRYRVVHCSCFPHAALIAAELALLAHRRTALIADWHEVLPRDSWRRRRGRLGDVAWLAQRLAVNCGRAAITFSSLHERRLREEGRRGSVYRVPEFPPEPRAPVGGDPPERENLLVFAGRLVDEKRAHLVAPVVAELRRHDPSWRAVIFGTGPEEARVRASIAEHGLDGAVRLAGYAPWPEVSRAMLAGRALLFPTLREGFGLVVIEAASHGLPSIVCVEEDNAAVELVEPGRNGEICPVADPSVQAAAVRALDQHGDIHERTREWFREASEHFSLSSCMRALRAVHKAVGSS